MADASTVSPSWQGGWLAEHQAGLHQVRLQQALHQQNVLHCFNTSTVRHAVPMVY